jgi:hypothetical protein
MSDGKINERILKIIEENCKNKKLIGEFLKELINWEVLNTHKWEWKDDYRNMIKKYSEK